MKHSEDLQQYIEWFRSSSAYINTHRNKVFVILLTGEALADKNLSNIVYDINLLNSLGIKLVLVHGARPQISATLKDAGIESEFHNDLRITDSASLEVIKQTVGKISIELEARFSLGLVNSPMHRAAIKLSRGNFITARPWGIHQGIDFCNTGRVRKVQSTEIKLQLDQGNIVLMSNLGYSPTGEVFNLSAEEIATETAIAVNADKLILFIPGQGVMDKSNELITSFTIADANKYLEQTTSDFAEQAVINHALTAAIRAAEANVQRVHLISHQSNGALLQELFTREGTGSLIGNDSVEDLRQAGIDDVGGILELIKPLEQSGLLVERSRELIEAEINNFSVVSYEGMVVACAALYPITDDWGEIACIATHQDYQNKGFGNRLLDSLEQSARGQDIKQIFILTTAANHWFLENGFQEASIDDLPESKKQLYNYQRNSSVLSKTL